MKYQMENIITLLNIERLIDLIDLICLSNRERYIWQEVALRSHSSGDDIITQQPGIFGRNACQRRMGQVFTGTDT